MTRSVLVSSGLIPAWAGKTNWVVGAFRRAWAHPRVGGENMKKADAEALKQGSSPRGRGKPPPPNSHGWWGRLIPAWAGKTPSASSMLTARQAHPRVGGENRMGGGGFSAGMGSSPRGRGKRKFVERVNY